MLETLKAATSAFCAVVASGCSLMLDKPEAQCRVDADCLGKGEQFSETVCIASLCMSRPVGCISTSQCVAQHAGMPYVCRVPGQSCVSVLTEDCTQLIPAHASLTDNTVLIGHTGSFTSSDPADQTAAQACANLMEMALGEFTRAVTGLPPISGSMRRPVVAVQCDDAADPDRMFNHLVDDLGIPAIIGNAYSSTVMQVAPTITIPGKTYFSVPLSGSPSITTLDDNNLVWRSIGSSTDYAEPMARMVDQLEAKARQAMSSTAEPIRLALMVSKGTLYSMVAEKFQAFLNFNQRSLTESLAAGTFMRSDYDDPTEISDADYTAQIAAITSFRPQIVVIIGGPETNSLIIPALEGAHDTSAWPYWYLIADGAYDPSALAAYGTNDNLRHRVVGVTSTVDPRTMAPFDAFKLRYKAAYPDPSQSSDGLESLYDSVYATLYAMIASAPGNAITGPGIADGMRAMSLDGKPITVGPTDWVDAFTTLSHGGKIMPIGIDKILAFNAAGDIPADPAAYCVSRNGATGEPELDVVHCNMIWDSATRSFVGSLEWE